MVYRRGLLALDLEQMDSYLQDSLCHPHLCHRHTHLNKNICDGSIGVTLPQAAYLQFCLHRCQIGRDWEQWDSCPNCPAFHPSQSLHLYRKRHQPHLNQCHSKNLSYGTNLNSSSSGSVVLD